MLKPLPPKEAPGISFARFTAKLAFVTLLLALAGRRMEIIGTDTMLASLAAVLILVTVALVSVGAVMTHIWRKGSLGFGRAFATLVLVVLTLLPFAGAGVAALVFPAIDEVTTDFDDLPQFVTRPVRPAPTIDRLAPVADYRRLQEDAYPDLVTRRLPLSTVEAHAVATLAARELGWTIRREQEPPSETVGGSFEAEGRTLVLGIPMDLSVRVMPEGDGSAVDVRSSLRYPVRDLGENARSVRRFFDKMDEVSSRAAR